MPRRRLSTYGRLDSAYAEVYEPENVDELKALLAKAQQSKRSVTFYGAGYSFDTQALNDDIVISTARLNRIKKIDIENATITVEPGVRWERILHNLRALGLTPPIMVTTGKATAGGTMAANCLSRSSPRYGKQGKHVERFQFLTLDGRLLECSRDENAQLFHAVIGGFGYLGVVTEITFKLLPIGKRTQVMSLADKYEGFDEMVRELCAQTSKAREEWDAIYAIAFFSGKKTKGFVFRSRYTDETNYKRMILYRPYLWARVPIEWLMRFSLVNNAVLNLVYSFFIKKGETYVDDLDGYTFFMDGNRRAKDIAAKLGKSLPAIQQTFVIPEAGLREFLDHVSSRLRETKLCPNLFDILHVPEDEFLMSASKGLEGYAVSIGFEDLNKERIQRLRAELEAISDVCLKLGGRVHLVKNVHASASQLKAMYSQAYDEFLEMKREYDPDGLLRNSFFTRIFGS